MPYWIDAEHFLWSTEREGHWQLELRSLEGESRAVTDSELGYIELLDVEDEAVWVKASPTPTEAHVYRVPLEPVDGEPAEATRVTRDEGVHDASFGPGGLWVASSHTLADGPVFHLRRSAEEDALGQLQSAAQTPPFVPIVEYITVGEKAFNALIVRPRNFEQGRPYPVLLSVYAGPGHIRVRKGRDIQLREQWQADHGFIVVSIDGRGTPGRGREWERSVRGNLIDIPLQDQVEGLRALGEQFVELDLDRVGVYGWSFGGYFSAMAVMREPELFKVGVAGAPVCDWRDYDTHYTERFMGLPSGNAEGYQAASVLTYAESLQRPLMIIHGTSDDNVYFTHALKMSDALIRSGKEHELVVLAGSTHMVADPAVARALQAHIMRFLMAGLST